MDEDVSIYKFFMFKNIIYIKIKKTSISIEE